MAGCRGYHLVQLYPLPLLCYFQNHQSISNTYRACFLVDISTPCRFNRTDCNQLGHSGHYSRCCVNYHCRVSKRNTERSSGQKHQGLVLGASTTTFSYPRSDHCRQRNGSGQKADRRPDCFSRQGRHQREDSKRHPMGWRHFQGNDHQYFLGRQSGSRWSHHHRRRSDS